MKKTVAIVMLAVLLLGLLAACGGGDGKYVGTYKLNKMESMSLQDVADYLYDGDLEKAKNFVTLELKSGGKASFNVDGEDPVDLTWKVDGEKISLTGKNDDGTEETIQCTVKDGVITMDMDGEVLELKK